MHETALYGGAGRKTQAANPVRPEDGGKGTMRMDRRTFLGTAGAGALGLTLSRAAEAAKPNVLILHTDEHNFRTLGCYRALLPADQAFPWGPKAFVATPHIDALARAGAVAERCYTASAVCTPSRAAFVSGRHPQNTGAIHNDLPMRDDVVTFGEVLRRNGWATAYLGKWHLDGPARPGWGPARKFGFEDNRYMFNRGHWKKLEETAAGPRVAARNARGEETYGVEGADAKSFTTDFLADRAVEFIRAHRGRPFCCMVSFPDPHGPNTVRAPYDTRYAPMVFRPPATMAGPFPGLPSWAQPNSNKLDRMAEYYGMVNCIDDNVGKLTAALRDAGLLEKTIVVFTSDHGDMCGEHGRHNKGIPLEASARIPFVIAAPGRVPAGSVVREAISNVDFKPTLLSLLGLPADAADEGRDFSALLAGRPAPEDAGRAAFLRIGDGGAEGAGGWIGVATRRFKLVFSPGDAPCLFDLEGDPFETRNAFAAPERREEVRRLARLLQDHMKRTREPWGEHPAIRADIEWAAAGTGPYVAPPRPEAKRGRAGRRAAGGADDE